MDKQEKKEYYKELHEKLAREFDLPEEAIKYIRSSSIHDNNSRDDMKAQLLNKVGIYQTEIMILREKIHLYERIIGFLQNATQEDFFTVTKK